MENSKINLCDTCCNSIPECKGCQSDVVYGDGIGRDNIISCGYYKAKETQDSRPVKVKIVDVLEFFNVDSFDASSEEKVIYKNAISESILDIFKPSIERAEAVELGLKRLISELAFSTQQGDLEIDGCHMNILAAWDEVDRVLKSDEINTFVSTGPSGTDLRCICDDSKHKDKNPNHLYCYQCGRSI